MKSKDLDELLKPGNTQGSLGDLHHFISEQCSWGNKMENLTEPQRTLFYNMNLQEAMDQGGLIQYFINSGGNFAHETVLSLRAIGANKKADILQSAIDLFPGKKAPHDRDERTEVMEKIERDMNPKWEKLDTKYHEIKEDLDSLHLEYIKKHKTEF